MAISNKKLIAEFMKRDKYGRILGNIYIKNIKPNTCINNMMVEFGCSRYYGGTKK